MGKAQENSGTLHSHHELEIAGDPSVTPTKKIGRRGPRIRNRPQKAH